MYELKIVTHFAAAHQLREFAGKCEKLHGHNWKVEVAVSGHQLAENGLLLDFREIKKATDEVLDGLDHEFLNELEAFQTVNPSSENIARFIFEALSRKLNNDQVRVSWVSAWESETACATYMEP
ncbi:MAG: 6-carboxytetrahydropterin synthase QueD [Deltaproteobacteria bacterium]|nr:6-carboxytetrahydropterin synthase QueD [Deltaproteobacteria bacterium]